MNASAASENRPGRTTLEVERGLVEARCIRCGVPARVKILRGYRNGRAEMEAFCIRCAEADDQREVIPQEEGRLRISALMLFSGVLIGIGGITADWLSAGSHAGFGIQQGIGVLLGVVLGMLGLILRADLVTVAGLCVFAVALVADVLGQPRTSGFGWKQQSIVAFALMLMACGLLGRWWKRHRRSEAKAAENAVGSTNRESPKD